MAEAEKEITRAPAEETEHTNKSEFPVEKIGDESPAAATSEEVVTEKTDVIPAALESAPVAEDSVPVAEMSAAVAEESVPGTEESAPVAEESVSGTDESAPVAEESVPAAEDTTSAAEENSDTPEQEDAEVQEAAEEKPTIKIETAPADFRFPTTNQTRHCFTRYIEYHRCIAAKGESASECDKFAKYYRSLCPSEWVERWNEQKENGTFPGPL